MIKLQSLNTLSDDEMGMLLYIVNYIKPPFTGGFVSPQIVSSYKKQNLINIVSGAESHILESGKSIHNDLLEKLKKCA